MGVRLMVHHDPQWSLRDGSKEGWQIRAEISPKWIRVKFGSEFIADSKRVVTVTETGKLPIYYFPLADIRNEQLIKSDKRTVNPNKGEAIYWHIKVGDNVIENAAWSFPNPPEKSSVISGFVSFVWNKADAWYEEEEEVFVHARDPYSRIDSIPSFRHVQIIIDGEIVADSKRSVILYETGLTPRYYLPKGDIKLDLLIPTQTQTQCPYKGFASYWSVSINGKEYKDVVWSYIGPLPEVNEIKGLLSFYNEAVDTLLIDREEWSLNSKDRLPYKKVVESSLN
jgi:uncharacterized protein (DUF427 family)